MTEPGVRYRLRGEVGGSEAFFVLEPGDNTVGRAADNAVVLPVHGISRRHALVRLQPDTLVLQDLDSRNGVTHNGRRVEQAPLAAGDRLGFGPVVLVLEPIAASDLDMAISFAGAQPAPSAAAMEENTTSYVATAAPGLELLRLVERVLARLGPQEPASLAEALSELRLGLEGDAAGLVECVAGQDPIVLGWAGPPEATGALAALAATLAAAAGRASEATPGTAISSEPAAACAVQAGPCGEPRALVVLGPRKPPAELEPLLRLLLRLVDRFAPPPGETATAARPRRTGLVFPPGHVRGRSPAMRRLYEQMAPLVQGDLPVLLVGETGVGKEHLARALHLSSPRHAGPFVAVNCAAIPAELLEAEMFGIVKGAATGVSERKGKFELAHGGTLLLDEVGDMPLELQAKLLRALQEREIQPVGGAPRPVDLRVVAATNADLLERADAGRFRRDLYYRVAGFVLELPPLRERGEDLPLLVEDFVRRFAAETGKPIRGVSVRALEALGRYAWPGNVRELEHEVRRLVYLCPPEQAIDSTMLSAHVLGSGATPTAERSTPLAGSLRIEEHVDALERQLVREALARAGGNRSEAARLLGISRNGLALKLTRLGLDT